MLWRSRRGTRVVNWRNSEISKDGTANLRKLAKAIYFTEKETLSGKLRKLLRTHFYNLWVLQFSSYVQTPESLIVLTIVFCNRSIIIICVWYCFVFHVYIVSVCAGSFIVGVWNVIVCVCTCAQCAVQDRSTQLKLFADRKP